MHEVGDALGVEAVLEGSARKSRDSLRITVQPLSAEDALEDMRVAHSITEQATEADPR